MLFSCGFCFWVMLYSSFRSAKNCRAVFSSMSIGILFIMKYSISCGAHSCIVLHLFHCMNSIRSWYFCSFISFFIFGLFCMLVLGVGFGWCCCILCRVGCVFCPMM